MRIWQGKPLISFTILPSWIVPIGSKKSFLEKALSYRNQIEDSLLLGNLELKIAGAWFNLQEFDSAISHYTRALEHLDENDSLYIADTYFFRGQAEDYKGNMLEAMQDYQIARDIYESQGDEDFANYAKGGMAILFSKYGIYEPAQDIREELVEFYKNPRNRRRPRGTAL